MSAQQAFVRRAAAISQLKQDNMEKGKKMTEVSAFHDRSDFDLFEILKPTIRFMYMLGMYVVDGDLRQDFLRQKGGQDKVSFNRRRGSFWKKFGFVMNVIAWVHLLRLIAGFCMAPKQAMFILGDPLPLLKTQVGYSRAIMAAFLFLCAMSNTVFYKAGQYTEDQVRFLQLWELVSHPNGHSQADLGKNRRSLNRIQCVMLVIALLFTAINTACHFIIYIMAATEMEVLSQMLFWLIIDCVLMLLATAKWVMANVWVTTVCIAFKKVLDGVNKDIDESVDHTGLEVCEWKEFEEAKDRHFHLTELITVVDRSVQIYMLFAIFTDVPLTCFILYQFMLSSPNFYTCVLMGAWLVFPSIQMFLLPSAGAAVHAAAHQSYLRVHGVSLQPLSQGKQIAVSIFARRLGGPEIGFTCLDLFVVTKGVILSILSVLVTYFLVILQFIIPTGEEGKGDAQNCTIPEIAEVL